MCERWKCFLFALHFYLLPSLFLPPSLPSSFLAPSTTHRISTPLSSWLSS